MSIPTMSGKLLSSRQRRRLRTRIARTLINLRAHPTSISRYDTNSTNVKSHSHNKQLSETELSETESDTIGLANVEETCLPDSHQHPKPSTLPDPSIGGDNEDLSGEDADLSSNDGDFTDSADLLSINDGSNLTSSADLSSNNGDLSNNADLCSDLSCDDINLSDSCDDAELSSSTGSDLSDDSDCSILSDTDSNEESRPPGIIENRTLLYSGSQMSTEEFYVVVLSMFLKHSLTYSSVSDILNLFSHTIPSPNSVPRTQYQLFKKFIDYEAETVTHHCCGYCTELLTSSSCLKSECREANLPDASFVELRLDKQLQRQFSGKMMSVMYMF